MNYRVFADFSIRHNAMHLYVSSFDRSGGHQVLVPTWVSVAEGAEIPPWSISDQDFTNLLQQFTNCAWERGIKPTGQREDPTELKATKYHLEDMRALVFKRDPQ